MSVQNNPVQLSGIGKREEILPALLGSAEKNETLLADQWSQRGVKIKTSKEKDTFLQELNEMIGILEEVKQEEIQELLRNKPDGPTVQEFEIAIDKNVSSLKGLGKRIDRKPVLQENAGTSLDTEEESVEEGIRSMRSQRARHRFLVQEEMKETFRKIQEEDRRASMQPTRMAPKRLVNERQRMRTERSRHNKWMQESSQAARLAIMTRAVYEGVPFDQDVKVSLKDQFHHEIEDFLKDLPYDGRGSKALESLIEIADSVVGYYTVEDSGNSDVEDVKERIYHECDYDEEVGIVLKEIGEAIQDRVLEAFSAMQMEHQSIEKNFQEALRESEEMQANEDYYRERWDKKRKVSLFESLLIANTRLASKMVPEDTGKKDRKTPQSKIMEETIFQYTLFEGINSLGIVSENVSDKVRAHLLHA